MHLWVPRCSQKAGKEVPGIPYPEPEVPSEEPTRRGAILFQHLLSPLAIKFDCWSLTAWVQSPALPLTSCVTSDKS